MLAASCESPPSLSLPHAMLTSAQAVGAGECAAPETGGRGRGPGDSFKDLPAFCRVAITVAPSADSDIKVEVWLPAAQWNGKFLAAGSGGGASAALRGSINFPGLAGPLRRGFATSQSRLESRS
jgi:feruloyl esterase